MKKKKRILIDFEHIWNISFDFVFKQARQRKTAVGIQKA